MYGAEGCNLVIPYGAEGCNLVIPYGAEGCNLVIPYGAEGCNLVDDSLCGGYILLARSPVRLL